jgi:hypothetical protein
VVDRQPAKRIPICWANDGANRNDVKLLAPTLAGLDRVGLLRDVETVHLDRWRKSRPARAASGAEGTKSWLSSYDQLRRNTDRRTQHRHAQLCLVTALLITVKLVDWRNRWSRIHALSAAPL